MKNNRRKGKRAEKRVAEILEGERLGILGGEDVRTDLFSIEVKTRKSFSGTKFLEQAIKNNKKGKIPIAIIHINHTHYKNSIVLIRLEDFLKLLKKGEGEKSRA